MIHETEQDYKLEMRDSQNLAENEEQRNLRLQRLRENRSLEKVNPYEYKRKLNSKYMTDYRSLVTTLLVERQNRLQLLQQNAAMYRENKRLQHLRDENNRDSYLSNGWRKTEQPLHEQQLIRNGAARLKLECSRHQFRDFGRKTHLFETVNRKRNF